MTVRSLFVILLATLFVGLGGCGAMRAQNPAGKFGPVNAVADGNDERVLLKGADVVAYFVAGQYQPGNAQFSSRYEDVTFRFASAEHKALFDAEPGKYLPQFGGYCANGIAYGIPWGGDADTWKIIAGKLYIFGGQASKDAFELDEAANLALAEKYWRDEIAGHHSFLQRAKRLVLRVPHYRSGEQLAQAVAQAKAAGRGGSGEMKFPRLIQIAHDDPEAIRRELLAGLTAPTAHIAPKYLYDALGSRLFAAITELTEYYPTRTEAAIFARERAAMAVALGPVATLVDLGAGNCEKAARLFDAFQVRHYVAVDISAAYLRESLENLQRQHPAMDMLGVGLDFSAELRLPAEVGDGPLTLFYPGSSIGNFTPGAALAFLRQAHAACRGGALLIGVDLVKPVAVLEPAYDDPLGVTAAFNRNLLLHLNHLAGTDFAIADWRHVALFNSTDSRIEMHLEALRDVHVRWPGGERRFAAGERLHTENSYKWRADDFTALLERAGFTGLRRWSDEAGWFAVFAAFAGARQ